MPHESNETLRKSIHIAFGLFAFTLKWLPWWAAAIAAACAVLGNIFVLHRLFGTRVARHQRGYDAGIVLYPLAILALILIYRNQLHIVAIAWTSMAFGDGLATVVGRHAPLASLPWNRDKSWGGFLAFLAAGTISGVAVSMWLGRGHILEVVIAVAAAAVAESLALGLDDNVTVPFAAAAALTVMWLQPLTPYIPWPRTTVWLAINTVLAIAGFLAGTVDWTGLIGGWALGAIVILGAGWPLYLALLTFFAIGAVTTKVGFARKSKAGLAQEKGGRRGLAHAFANVAVAAVCAIAVSRISRMPVSTAMELLPLFMGITALATAAADTAASEVGQLLGRRAFLAMTLRRVPVGTEGAISLEGTFAGAIAAALVAMVGTTAAAVLWPIGYRTRMIVLVTLCALVGSYLESVAGSWNRRHGSRVTNGALNFFNTVAGALLFFIAWQIAI